MRRKGGKIEWRDRSCFRWRVSIQVNSSRNRDWDRQDGKEATRHRISGRRKVAGIKFPAMERLSPSSVLARKREAARGSSMRESVVGTPLIRINLEFNEETGPSKLDSETFCPRSEEIFIKTSHAFLIGWSTILVIAQLQEKSYFSRIIKEGTRGLVV